MPPEDPAAGAGRANDGRSGAVVRALNQDVHVLRDLNLT
jgi:hypothetical protein